MNNLTRKIYVSPSTYFLFKKLKAKVEFNLHRRVSSDIVLKALIECTIENDVINYIKEYYEVIKNAQ